MTKRSDELLHFVTHYFYTLSFKHIYFYLCIIIYIINQIKSQLIVTDHRNVRIIINCRSISTDRLSIIYHEWHKKTDKSRSRLMETTDLRAQKREARSTKCTSAISVKFHKDHDVTDGSLSMACVCACKWFPPVVCQTAPCHGAPRRKHAAQFKCARLIPRNNAGNNNADLPLLRWSRRSNSNKTLSGHNRATM